MLYVIIEAVPIIFDQNLTNGDKDGIHWNSRGLRPRFGRLDSLCGAVQPLLGGERSHRGGSETAPTVSASGQRDLQATNEFGGTEETRRADVQGSSKTVGESFQAEAHQNCRAVQILQAQPATRRERGAIPGRVTTVGDYL